MKNTTFMLVFYLKFLGLEDKNLWLVRYFNGVTKKQKKNSLSIHGVVMIAFWGIKKTAYILKAVHIYQAC